VESYAYNIRNWTDTIKSGTFEEDLFYNSNLPTGVTPCYNGNIAYSTWTYNGVVKGYQYTYDDLNRLTNAYFKKGTSSSSDNDFSENFVYDKMGNITSLKRSMSGHYIDILIFAYSGNQLSRVGDDAGSLNLYAVKEYPATTNATSGPSMTYDKNGNLVYDYDRKIATIRYNILNLPDTIQFTTGNQIINRYAADGRKLKTDYYTYLVPLAVPLDPGKVITNPTYVANVVNLSGTSYVDNAEYTRRSDGLTYANGPRVYNSEGYTTGDGITVYSYYHKDHLGNNREVWDPNNIGTGNIIQRTEYYPSGLPWSEGSGESLQPRKYNGKEFIEMDGYDTYDYGARGLQAATMRFMTMDPLAEMYYSVSPYVYCKDNPVNYIDPNGEFSTKAQAWWYKLWHGGGQTQQDKKTGEYFVFKQTEYKGSGAGVAGTRRFDWGGRSQGEKQYGQTYGEHSYGTGTSQTMELPTSKYHGPSINMKEASNDAIDMWAKIFNNNASNADSNPTTNQTKDKKPNDEETDEDSDNDEITYEVITSWEKIGNGYSANTYDRKIVGPRDSTKNRLKRIKLIKGVQIETIRIAKQTNQW
jgi:RHS repeat-associated protein